MEVLKSAYGLNGFNQDGIGCNCDCDGDCDDCSSYCNPFDPCRCDCYETRSDSCTGCDCNMWD